MASQNAQQATSGAYSYTGYDPLGRITEVGEKVNGPAISQSVAQDAGQLAAWMSSGSLRQITRTVYDWAYAPFGNPPLQARNLRNRVAYSYVADVADGSQFRTGTFYSYDIHGNVDVLLQYYRQGVMFAAGNAFKRVEYRYDLVSGKVNEVAYQPGQADGFYHRYHYDAENRLTGAESSRDRLLWQQDAAYRYYRHGPLARTQLGQLNVQGIDYAYTLQGWLKGVNSSQIGKGATAYYDMGGDDGSSISQTAKDVYSYSLHYYDDAGRSDYRPIGRAVVAAPFSNFEQVGGSVSSPLYNGNIAAMGVQIDYGAGGGGQGTGLREPLLYGYRYDQLHRLVGMQAHRNLVNNQWRPVALDDYREWVSYDANGNIRSYDRNGTTTAYGTPVASHALEMDRLSYGYTEVSLNGRQVLTSNRLRHVKDQVSDANRYTEDIDNQADDNYSYDAIGNLVRDQQGGSEEIRWTVYGKIAGIHKTDGTQVYYSYDAAGNRISKTVDRSGSTNPSAGITTTWYVRDAQGNVLSTYEKRGSSPLEQTELHLYGSSRLGIQRTGGLVVEGSLVPLYTYNTETLVRGRKLYELSNHLGNVLATITDKKVLVADGGSAGGTGGVCANGGLVEVLDLYNRDGSLSSYRARQEINFYSNFESGSSDEWEGYIDAGATLCDNNGGGGTGSGMPAGSYYVADLVSGTDYAPFGMGLVGRTYNAGVYKYGFNGKERDQDIGEDSYDYGMRISDQRLGRFLSVDPLTPKYPELTPYQYASNRPIDGVDQDGLEWGEVEVAPSRPLIQPITRQATSYTSQTTARASMGVGYNGGLYVTSNTNPYLRPNLLTARNTTAENNSGNGTMLRGPSYYKGPYVAGTQNYIDDNGYGITRIYPSAAQVYEWNQDAEHAYRVAPSIEMSKKLYQGAASEHTTKIPLPEISAVKSNLPGSQSINNKGSDDDFASVRFQVQTGTANISSKRATNTIESGVTKQQGYQTLAEIYRGAVEVDPSLGKNKDFRSAIINISVKIKAINGGMSKGVNQTTLQEMFRHNGKPYRVDVEVQRGDNFKR